jgi:hypothetical protein
MTPFPPDTALTAAVILVGLFVIVWWTVEFMR